MNSIASSSSSKESFPFHNKNTNHYDSLISNQSHYSSSSFSSFRTTTTAGYDSELFLGDDCDSSYEATLMQSGLLDWLQCDMDGFPKTSTRQELFCCCATPRLEMILSHITHGNNHTTTTCTDRTTNKKETNKSQADK
jgi:hypothetical protein